MALFVGTADLLIRTEGRERDVAGGVGIRSLAETEARWAGNNGCSSSPTVTTLPDSAPAAGREPAPQPTTAVMPPSQSSSSTAAATPAPANRTYAAARPNQPRHEC